MNHAGDRVRRETATSRDMAHQQIFRGNAKLPPELILLVVCSIITSDDLKAEPTKVVDLPELYPSFAAQEKKACAFFRRQCKILRHATSPQQPIMHC